MSLTNISFPEEKTPLLHEAIAYYNFESMGAFFRTCGHVIIEHYRRGDELSVPFRFTNGNHLEAKITTKCKRSEK